MNKSTTLMSGFTVSAAQVLEQCRLRYMQTLCDIVAAREGFSVKLYTAGDDNLIKIAPFTKRNLDVVEAYKLMSPKGSVYPYTTKDGVRNILSPSEAAAVTNVLTYVWIALISSFIVQHPSLRDWLDTSEEAMKDFNSAEAHGLLTMWTKAGSSRSDV